MLFKPALSLAVTVSLLTIVSVRGTSLVETKTKLKALQSLVLNNAQATVKLDSTALKQLLKLSSYGMVQLHGIKVSFSVNMKAKELNLGGGQTVIYDEVLTNDGKGYDDRTGVFTSPVAGTYMFVVDALSPKPLWLRIFLNKTIVASLHISESHSNGVYLQISRTVILKLRKGDHVKVVSAAKGSVHNNGYSGFSGAKLY
uniref:C1q-related factor-like n=1 Tax=Crassostrea virginica TaxID=6565 RepID=A0A8B8BGR7_CRAVI|nr:C1q-related factor-like [Crassostrea virginica]